MSPASPTIVNALPHQHRPRPPLEEGPRRSYHLSTSEALDGQKIVFLKDEVGRIVWSKTRDLVDDEIVDTVFDGDRHPRWTIHRPTTGWYLILRSPSLPSGSYISLKPNPRSPSTFNFHIRTVLSYPEHLIAPSTEDLLKPIDDSVRLDFGIGDKTPTTTSFDRFGSEEKEKKGSSDDEEEKGPRTTKSLFKLQPGLPAHTHRVSSRPFSLSSFTGLFADRGKTWSCVWEDEGQAEIVRFEEVTSLLSTTTKGNLILSENLIGIVGMEPTFWIAVSLAYLEFLEEREAYNAASGGD